MQKIPRSLRNWFLVHFTVDMIFGIPLLLAPAQTLELFGLSGEIMITARLVGAALIGIGGTSLLMHKAGREAFQTMLSLKIVWSLAAILALLLAIIEGAPQITWGIFGIFAIFSATWMYYKKTV